MANTAPIPYQFLAIDIPAGETRNIPGQFTWVEILQEFQTATPDVNSQAVTIGFYPGQPQQILPPAITVILPVGFPSVSAQLVNTDSVNDVTVWLITGNGQIPAVDHRLVLPVGSLLNVVVTNTNADPVPVSITGQPIEVTALTALPVSDAPIAPGTACNATGNVDLVSAAANVNGAIINDMNLSVTGPGDYLLQVNGQTIFGVTGGAAGQALDSQLQHRYLVPAGQAISVLGAGAATANRAIGNITLL